VHIQYADSVIAVRDGLPKFALFPPPGGDGKLLDDDKKPL